MKEHEDDVLPSVKESTSTAGSTAGDEIVTETGRIEGFLGERDGGEDMMVDVVGADVVVDDHEGTRVDLDTKAGSGVLVEEGLERETESRDLDMEDVAGLGEDGGDALVGSRVLTNEKDEVVVSEEGVTRSVEASVEVLEANVVTTDTSGLDGDAQKSGNDAVVANSKMDFEQSSLEPQVGGREIFVRDAKDVTNRALTEEIMEQPTESVQEVVDGDVIDENMRNEAKILDSSKVRELLSTTANLGSSEVDVVVVKEGLLGKDEAEDTVNNQSLSTDVVNAGVGEDKAYVSITNLDKQVEVDQLSKEESLLPRIEVTANDAENSRNGTHAGDSTMVAESLRGEPQYVGGEVAVREEESERGLTEETVEVADGHRLMNEKTGKEDEALDSEKIPDSETTTNLGSEEADVAIVEEGLARKDEAQDNVSDNPSLIGPDNCSLSAEIVNAGISGPHVNAKYLDEQAEVDRMSKAESSHLTMEVVTNDAQKCGTVTAVGDFKMADEPSSRGEVAVMAREEETEGGLTEEIMERPVESVQELGDGDGMVCEKTRKEDQLLHSSKILESSIGLVEVDVVDVEERLGGKDEAQDGVSMHPSSLCPDNRSLSEEVVSAGNVYAENSDLKSEVDPVCKDERLHPTIEVITTDAAHGSLKVSDLDSTLPSSVEGEVLIIENKVCDPGKSIDDVKVEGLELQAVDESSKTDAAAHNEADEVDASADVDEVATTAREVRHSKLLVPTTDGMSVENQRSTVNTETESSQPDVVACTVPESSIDQSIPASANEVVEMDQGVQNCKVELPTTGDRSSFLEDQGLKAEALSKSSNTNATVCANLSNDQFVQNSGNEVAAVHTGVPNSTVEVPGTGETNDFQVSAEAFEEVNHATTHADFAEPGVLPADAEFSYEEAHVERGQDAGMDIDEVLGWKDEIPGIDTLSGGVGSREKDQHLKINGNSEADIEQRHMKSSCAPVLVGEQEEDLKLRQPIVYERRVNIEFPLHDALYGSSSLQVRDENLKLVTQYESSEEDDRSMQEEEQKIQSTNLSSVDDKLNEDAGEHSGTKNQMDFCRGQETEALEHSSEPELSTGTDVVTDPVENETLVTLQQSCYFQPPENEGKFAVSDLVWGKVRSHPWWPGQIFDPSDASEKAMKYHKKDCFLVAYFGDRTFAWNESTVLKPFRANFSQIEKHSNSEAFKNAVSCALEEVSRRVELGLACSCVSQDIYEKIEYQVVENAGIRQESSRRHGVDESAGVSSFEPDKLVDYVRLLAKFPYGKGDKMELAMAKAQLSSYVRYKGYRQLPEFLFCGDLLEDTSILHEGVGQISNDGQQISDKSDIGGEYNASHKFEDNAHPNMKERSSSEVTDDAPYSEDGEDGAEGRDGNSNSALVSSSGSRKRKALDSISDGSEKRPNLHSEKVPSAQTPIPKPSFKVGECIQRVASQLTGPPSAPKCSSDKKGEHADQPAGFTVSVQNPENSQRGRMTNQSSLAEMLSQLHLAAQDPMKGYSFLNTIIPFFYSHRAAVFSKSLRQNSSTGRPNDARKRKPSNENYPEEFEFDDVNDSYWTDRIIQHYPEEQLLQDNQNGGGEYQLVSYEQDKPVKPSRRSNKKRFFSSNHEIEAKEQSELLERRRQNLATEVLLKFPEGIYFPSEIHLNKMFKRFGPLMESETEVDRQSGRARVVFKKCSDAEVAHSSAGKFNIFGSVNVNYELNYNPLVSYKPLPLPIVEDLADAC